MTPRRGTIRALCFAGRTTHKVEKVNHASCESSSQYLSFMVFKTHTSENSAVAQQSPRDDGVRGLFDLPEDEDGEGDEAPNNRHRGDGGVVPSNCRK
jgi:hypothetical protein